LINEYKEYADAKNISLNPNEKIVDAVVNGLLDREDKFGKRYCPCRKMTGDVEEDKKIICPCVYHLEEIESLGNCHCNLFVKK
jgi:ferredoxin-thioredoxin reductase catalytic subunit